MSVPGQTHARTHAHTHARARCAHTHTHTHTHTPATHSDTLTVTHYTLTHTLTHTHAHTHTTTGTHAHTHTHSDVRHWSSTPAHAPRLTLVDTHSTDTTDTVTRKHHRGQWLTRDPPHRKLTDIHYNDTRATHKHIIAHSIPWWS